MASWTGARLHAEGWTVAQWSRFARLAAAEVGAPAPEAAELPNELAAIRLGELASADEWERDCPRDDRSRCVARVYSLVEHEKERRRLYDFDDMIVLAVRLLRTDRRAARALAVGLRARPGRRVPGHRARAGTAGADARRTARRPLRRRRRGPDAVRLAARERPPHDRPRRGLSRAAPGGPRAQLPLHAGGDRGERRADRQQPAAVRQGDQAGRRVARRAERARSASRTTRSRTSTRAPGYSRASSPRTRDRTSPCSAARSTRSAPTRWPLPRPACGSRAPRSCSTRPEHRRRWRPTSPS